MNEERNLREILAVLQRHRGLLLAFVGSAIISSLAITYVSSERYKAGTLIMFRSTEGIDVQPKVVVPNTTAFGFPVPTLPFEALGTTIEQVGRSEKVLRKVVVDLKLDQPDHRERTGIPWLFNELKDRAKRLRDNSWQILKFGRILKANPTTQAIIELSENTTFEVQQNYTIRLIVQDTHPVRAAMIVDKIAEELVIAMRELGVESARERAVELESRLVGKKSEIKAVREAIENVKQENSFVSLNDEITLHLTTIEDLEKKRVLNEAELRDTIAQRAAIEATSDSIDKTLKSSETLQDDPLYSQLRSMVTQYEVESEGLQKRFHSNHVDVVELTAKIERAREELEGLEPQRVSSVTNEVNDLYEKLLADSVALEAKIAGLQAANDSLDANIASRKSRLVSPAVESSLDDLELQLQTLELDFTYLASAREEAYTTALTSLPEVQALYASTPMDAPFRPIKVYHAGLSGLLSTFLGIGAVYLVDFVQALWNRPDHAGELVLA